MHLVVPPGSPTWMHVAADAALITHVGGGAVGLLAGTTALLARKGSPLHRAAGNVFFVAMMVGIAVATCVAPLLKQWSNVIGGTLTLYLLSTAWVTVKRP